MIYRLRWSRALCLAATFCLAGGLASQAQESRPRQRYVWTEKEALVARAPELIAAPNVLGAQWSPNGTRLVVVRQSPIPDSADPHTSSRLSVLLWSSGSRRATEIWKRSLALPSVRLYDRIQWMSGGEAAVIALRWREPVAQVGPDGVSREIPEDRQGALFVDAVSGQVRIVPLDPQDTISLSPTAAIVALYGYDRKILRFLRLDGTVEQTLMLPAIQRYPLLDWSEDGRRFVLKWFEPVADRKSMERKWMIVNPKRGEIEAAEKEPKTYRAPALPPSLLTARHTFLTIKEGDASHTIHPLWLDCGFKSDHMRMLITPDCEQGSLSRTGENVLYVSQQTAWVVPLTRVTREVMNALLRTEALYNGRMVGTALIMYAQDYDETFPPTGSDVSSLIMPYLKDADALSGFNYLGNGAKLSDLDNPVETVLGSIDGPGGAAIVYADGHVKWKNQ